MTSFRVARDTGGGLQATFPQPDLRFVLATPRLITQAYP